MTERQVMQDDEKERPGYDGWKPRGSRVRLAFIYTYAVIFCLIFLGWPAALSIWLTRGAGPEMKAICWSGVITWLIFHQSFLSQFCYPFGRLSALRWLIMWPLHRDFGRVPFWMTYLAAREAVFEEIERSRRQPPKS